MKEKAMQSEIGFDGDTGECQLIICLGTKNESKANKIADKIIAKVNGSKAPVKPKGKK